MADERITLYGVPVYAGDYAVVKRIADLLFSKSDSGEKASVARTRAARHAIKCLEIYRLDWRMR